MFVLGNCFLQYIIIILHFQIFSCLFSKNFDNLIQYNIEENQPAGLIIGKISEDIKRHSNPTWFLVNNLKFSLSVESLLFDLDSKTGMIKTKTVIDLENLCPKNCIKDKGVVNLTVNIWSQTNLQGIAKVSIIIDDINDNYPVFDKEFVEFSIKETVYTPGKSIKLPRATDIDVSEKNNEISYKLKDKSDYFTLQIDNKIQPILWVNKTMDSEEVSRFNLVLLAWNTHFPKLNQTILNIIINVININDNEPKFSKDLYRIPVPENTPVGSIVHKVSAYDLDIESQLSYWPADPSSSITSIFKIELQGSIRLLRSLDFESQAFYYMSIKVTDGEFNAFTKLKFVVIDVNDEPPNFQLNPTNVSIYENSDPMEIAQVTIFDRDSVDINGKLKCYEPDHLKNQQIVSFTQNINNYLQYTIKLVQMLDRDVQGGDFQYALLVCEDNGIPMKLSSTFTLTINVLDRNDNYPVFSLFPTTIMVTENSPINQPLYRFEARDKDRNENAKIRYDIRTLHKDCCRIDEETGNLYSIYNLDREQKDNYQLIIIATDQSVSESRLTTSISVNITVLDENDVAPSFLTPFNFSILENQPHQTFIGTLKAIDYDIGSNSELKFSLMTDINSVFFILCKNGSLFSRKSFDREHQDEYCLHVTVEDHGIQVSHSAKERICIQILDENDNSPIIYLPEFEEVTWFFSNNKSVGSVSGHLYRLNVSMHTPVSHSVGYIKVRDADFGQNGNISVNLVSDHDNTNIVRLNPSDGDKYDLILMSNPFKISNECYQYNIVATDHGKPPKRTEKSILLCFINQPAVLPKLLEKDRVLSISKANILIVIILAGTSAFLTALLVSAILCMIQPCKELNRRRYTHSSNVIDSSNHNANETIMDNLLKSREDYEEQFLSKMSESNIDENFNIQSKIQDNWPLKLIACNDLNCQSVLIPQSSYIVSAEEQRSDSGRGASDEDNNIITSSNNITKLSQMNQMFLMNSLIQSLQPGYLGRQDANEMNSFPDCDCETFPKVMPLNRPDLFSEGFASNSLTVNSKTPIPTKKISQILKQNNSDLVMENCIYRSSNVEDIRTIPIERHSPVLSISDLSSHIDNLFFSQCCKKY